MASWSTYLQVVGHLALLCFFVPIRIDNPVETEFQAYLQKFNKTYMDPVEYQYRLEAFEKSLDTIATFNSNRSNITSAHYGLTKFSDLPPEDFQKTHLRLNLTHKLVNDDFKRERRAMNDLPMKVDWREKNFVTAVKNQEDCGACWAFSAVETIESMNGIQNKNLEELSVQQLIDCAGYGNYGCDGGDVCTLLLWMKENQVKVQSNRDYPFNLKNQRCKMNASSLGVEVDEFSCNSFVGNEEIMLDLLSKNGPLAVAINAKTWQNYIGGVIQYHCDSSLHQLNHAVQIVGYDLTAEIPYYIVRNTWGEDFGDRGYLYLAIGKNMCGLANEVAALRVL